MDSIPVMVAKRLLFGIVTLFIISVLFAIGIELLPGDLAEAVLGQSATKETVAAFQRELGLDRPPHIRYLEWLERMMQGDLGTSLANDRKISELIDSRLGNTVFLAVVTAIISVPLAIFLGILAALYRETWFDKSISMVTLSTISFPEFFVAYILIIIFSIQLGILPSISNYSPDMSFAERLRIIALPTMTLTLVIVAHMMRMTRAAIINVLSSPFIEMAQLKGIKPSRIIIYHALPNALSPIITVIALNLAYLVVGVVVVEVVFVYPGVGQLLVDSVSKRDLPVVQATGIIFAATYVLLNLTADILSILVNPKLRHPK